MNDIIFRGNQRFGFPLVYVFIHTVCALSCTLAVNVYVFYMYISDGVISFCYDSQKYFNYILNQFNEKIRINSYKIRWKFQ